jgi:hypothetical protein
MLDRPLLQPTLRAVGRPPRQQAQHVTLRTSRNDREWARVLADSSTEATKDDAHGLQGDPTMTWRDLFPVVTLILGSVLTVAGGLFAESHRHRWAWQRAKEERNTDRRIETIAFERDMLLQLQDAGQDLLDSTFDCFIEKWRTIEESPEADGPIPSAHHVATETDHRRRISRLQTEKLLARVEDDELRELGQKLTRLTADLMKINHYEDARRVLSELQTGFMEANDVLGAVLRSLLKGDAVVT